MVGMGDTSPAYKARGLPTNYRKSKPAHDLLGVARKYPPEARTSECAEVSHGDQYLDQASSVPGPLDGRPGPASAQPVPARGEGPGPVEHRHRPGTLLLPARCRPGPLLLALLQPTLLAATPPGVVLRSRGQEGPRQRCLGRAAARLGPQRPLRRPARLAPGGLARPPTRPGLGSHQSRRPLHRPQYQRFVSRLCRPRDLDRRRRRRAGRLGAALGTHAPPPGRPCSRRLAGAGLDRPRDVFAPPVRLPGGTALAPVSADPRPGVLPPRRQPKVA